MTDSKQGGASGGADENKLIAERRAKLAALRHGREPLSQRLPPRCARRAAARLLRVARGRVAQCQSDARAGRRPADVQARHGQGELRQDRRPHRPDPAVPADRGARRRPTRRSRAGTSATSSAASGVLFRTKAGELSVRADALAAAREVAASAAGQVARSCGHRNALPPALRRSHRERAQPQRVPHTHAHHPLPARLSRCARFPRSRDADDAADPGRGCGAPVPHPSQRAGSGHVPAHRPGAVPEAPHRRRPRARVRDQPQFPQRGALDPAQPGIHDARAVPGVRRLSRSHGVDREGDPRPCRYASRYAADHLPGPRVRSGQALSPHDGGAGDPRAQPRHRSALAARCHVPAQAL